MILDETPPQRVDEPHLTLLERPMFSPRGLDRQTELAAILLSGGGSRRMGFDKASVLIDGIPAAERIARELSLVSSPIVEVGPGRSRLWAIADDVQGSGPLLAIAAGTRALRGLGYRGSVLVVACDLPLLTATGLSALAAWPDDCSVVPLIRGRAQTLCAKWCERDLSAAEELSAKGERSMRCLLAQPGVVLVDETRWPPGVVAEFQDADTPEDLDRLAVRYERPGFVAPQRIDVRGRAAVGFQRIV